VHLHVAVDEEIAAELGLAAMWMFRLVRRLRVRVLRLAAGVVLLMAVPVLAMPV